MKKAFFTVGFMLAVTVFFIFILAFVHEISGQRITRNLAIQKMRSILYAFNIFPEGMGEKNLSETSTTADVPWKEADLVNAMKQRIKTITLPVFAQQRELLKGSFLSIQDSAEIYVLFDHEGNIAAYGFPLRGKGLWGTISAFAVVSSDFSRMLGIDFTDQVETPGLGARILEKEFKSYFRGLDLKNFFQPIFEPLPIVMVSKKDHSNLEQSTNSIQAITGATQTCNGVLNMINTDLRFYIRLLSENREVLNRILLWEELE